MRHSEFWRKAVSLFLWILITVMFSATAFAIDGIVSIPIENKTMRPYIKGSGNHTIVLLCEWSTEDPINDFNPLVEKLSDEYQQKYFCQ